MPTVLRIGSYRFFFYAGDRGRRRMFMSNEAMMSPGTGSIRFDFNEAWGSVASSFGESTGWSNITANGY